MAPISSGPLGTRILALVPLLVMTGLTACRDEVPAATLFQVPIEGEQGADWFYGPLPNHVAGAGHAEDYNCGTKAIDYRQLTAFLLPSLQAMHDGVNVLAAAAGEVVGAVDAYEEDEHLRYDYGRPGNRVRILHEDGIQSVYHNLKFGSVAVEVGDRVEAGQVIGQAGSSGDSDWPRVGFEAVDETGATFDPWAGMCGSPASFWANQPEYPNAFMVIDRGTTDEPLSLRLVAEGPREVTTFQKDQDIFFWVNTMNRPEGFVTIRLLGPEQPMDSVGDPYSGFEPGNYVFAGALRVPSEDPAGSWALEYALDGQVFAVLEFQIVEASAAGAEPVAAAPTGRRGGAQSRLRTLDLRETDQR